MTSLERVLTVLRHGTADRVPLGELWIDPKVVEAIAPGATANDLVEQLDMDMVVAHTMIYEPHEVEWVDAEKKVFRDKWGALQTLTQDAIPIPTKPARIETPEELAAYTPPDPAESPVLDKLRALKARYPNGEKVVTLVAESGWAPALGTSRTRPEASAS